MRLCLLLLVFLGTSANGDDWSPPKNPDPHAILREAKTDTGAGRYEDALAKHIWFHKNVLSIDPAMYGVRLSFALSYWGELAKEHPPALKKLKEIRDQAKKSVMEETDIRESFHDMAAINDQLEEVTLTKTVFEALDTKNPNIAKQVFDLAKPALVQDKAYQLLAKYVAPEDDFNRMLETYKHGQKLAEDPQFGSRHLNFANNSFANETTTLVAILAVNNRMKEAEEIATSARAAWNDESFHTSLENALKGIVPAPWP